MEDFLKILKIIFYPILLGAIYGGVIGAGLALLTSINVGVASGAFAWFGFWFGAWSFAWACFLTEAWVASSAWACFLTLALLFPGAWVGVASWALLFAGAWEYLAERRKTTSEALIENHIVWIFSIPIAIFRLLSSSQSSIKRYQKSETKQRAWDVGLIITFTQELAEVFPEEWDEWQHWVSDMMASRTRMQSKGMNHRLVSLITFYRLTRFAWHIGIDKVYILATRRATR